MKRLVLCLLFTRNKSEIGLPRLVLWYLNIELFALQFFVRYEPAHSSVRLLFAPVVG